MNTNTTIIITPLNYNKITRKNNNGGFREGISRCLSQMTTYPFESHKIKLQVYGHSSKRISFNGIYQSSITSGIIFSLYYTIYNKLQGNPLASTISSVITSFIKIPIGNCMRLLQLNTEKTNIIKCAKAIILMKGFKGLYSGYTLSICEDVIEHNIRNTIYDFGKVIIQEPITNMIIGCFAGSFAAGITTPFDTMKSKLINDNSCKINIFNMIYNIHKTKGIKSLYAGCSIRTLSNATRYGMYYIFLEMIGIIIDKYM